MFHLLENLTVVIKRQKLVYACKIKTHVMENHSNLCSKSCENAEVQLVCKGNNNANCQLEIEWTRSCALKMWVFGIKYFMTEQLIVVYHNTHLIMQTVVIPQKGFNQSLLRAKETILFCVYFNYLLISIGPQF